MKMFALAVLVVGLGAGCGTTDPIDWPIAGMSPRAPQWPRDMPPLLPLSELPDDVQGRTHGSTIVVYHNVWYGSDEARGRGSAPQAPRR